MQFQIPADLGASANRNKVRKYASRQMNSPVSASDELWLRSRFAEPRNLKPVTEGDGHLWRSDREIRPAAVLVPVVKRAHGLTVLFTRRTAHLNDHAGQI